jgi:hypothetical protein
MSDIFYSQVDANLQLELLARAAAGKGNRRTEHINYMVSKIANVAITPYDVTYVPVKGRRRHLARLAGKPQQFSINKNPITEAILGGAGVRQGEYLPTGEHGFITDRIYSITGSDGNATSRTNTSKRIPPYLTGLEVSIGDDSMGMMQTATANVTIPNPGRDLDYFESVYLRPGRNVKILIEHPDTAILTKSETGGYLTTESMASPEQLETLYPGITAEQIEKYRKMNAFEFDGVIISFTLDYQLDASVAASLTMRGTTQVYTDLSMAMSDASKKTNDSESAEGIAVTTFHAEIEKVIENKRKELASKTSGIYIDDDVKSPLRDVSYIWGAPKSDMESMKYITLKALINFVNEFILPKAAAVVGKDVKIVFDRELNTCKYYENLVSADPLAVFFPGQDDYRSFTWYGNLGSKKPKFFKADNEKPEAYCTLIYISTTTIDEIITAMAKAETYTLAEFLSKISATIYYASGGAYDLKLITHPDFQNKLLYYDSNNVKSFSNVPKAFNVPMFANNEIGTIVKDFQFNGKLPTDASNLAYVLNQDPGNISESEIAPFLSYMYSATQTQRDEFGNDTVSHAQSAETLAKINQSYEDNNAKYLRDLTFKSGSIAIYGKDMDQSKNQTALHTSLQKYIQYPKSSLADSVNLKAPVIPFDASFTIEGVNGFRYGDVLEFSGLPKRYTNNTVFGIIGINHSVSAEGEWTTRIQCIMRPRIDFKK